VPSGPHLRLIPRPQALCASHDGRGSPVRGKITGPACPATFRMLKVSKDVLKMDPPAIATSGLTKSYGSRAVVHDLTFDVPFGRVTGFLGPNGAGKTTTMRTILALARPTAGTAQVLGRRYADIDRPAGEVGVLLDAATFHPQRNARDHLLWLTRASGIPSSRIPGALEAVDLADAADRHVGEYSLGMRQRLGLAAALIGEPRLLVLDEPANGLDPAGIRWLRELLASFAHSGGAVFVSSHLLGEMAQLADDVIVIARGELVTHTTVDALMAGRHRAARVRTPMLEALMAVLAREGHEARVEDAVTLVVPNVEAARVGELAAAAGVVLHGLADDSHSLEEVFLDLTKEREDAGVAPI
jgi:ABC-2 type transport system ATP-binding protein